VNLNTHIRLVGMLAWQDVLQRYRRSVIGQFWITISMGVLILCLGFLFGVLFKTPHEQFVPFLAAGLIFWMFISNTINDSGLAFIGSSNIIRQIALPGLVFVLRVVWRNIIVLAHNLAILPLLALYLGAPLSLEVFLFIPGLLLLSLNLIWSSYLIGLFCTRFRDLPQIIQSVLQIFFYITPIIWMPNLLEGRSEFYFIEANPFYHLIEIVRAPLLGAAPSFTNWFVSVLLLCCGSVITLLFAQKYKHRIAYWL
jgi:ABC-type polysaccharide/polyol phosphate export permease